jgi:hypothetical protein
MSAKRTDLLLLLALHRPTRRGASPSLQAGTFVKDPALDE